MALPAPNSANLSPSEAKSLLKLLKKSVKAHSGVSPKSDKQLFRLLTEMSVLKNEDDEMAVLFQEVFGYPMPKENVTSPEVNSAMSAIGVTFKEHVESNAPAMPRNIP